MDGGEGEREGGREGERAHACAPSSSSANQDHELLQ
jgi:hypothetical protein